MKKNLRERPYLRKTLIVLISQYFLSMSRAYLLKNESCRHEEKGTSKYTDTLYYNYKRYS